MIYVVNSSDAAPDSIESFTSLRTDLRGMDLVTKVIDPEIRRFEDWFQIPERGNGPLTRLEKDLLRSYLYQKLTGTL